MNFIFQAVKRQEINSKIDECFPELSYECSNELKQIYLSHEVAKNRLNTVFKQLLFLSLLSLGFIFFTLEQENKISFTVGVGLFTLIFILSVYSSAKIILNRMFDNSCYLNVIHEKVVRQKS